MKKTPRDVGESRSPGLVTVSDVMTGRVMTVTRHQTVGHLRELMSKHGISCVPVVNADGEPEGIVTSSDLVDRPADETRVSQIMTREVVTIPQYAGVHLIARTMRNHRIHHVLVTHEKKVVGLVSSFDLLKLIENKRFVPKNRPTTPKRSGKRRRDEGGGA